MNPDYTNLINWFVFILILVLFLVSIVPTKQELYSSLLESDNEGYQELEVNRVQVIESILLRFLEIGGVFVTAQIVEEMSQFLLSGFDPSMLYGVLILPLLYILRDLPDTFEVIFVKASMSKNVLLVKTGYRFQRVDKLELKTVENVELFSTPLGRVLNYGTLMVYSYGSNICIPHVKNPLKIQKEIMSRVNKDI
ncbi:hypothetical protein [Photobacterium leiognathi]|uniref:hypothetical protein n=1 Tax=Photobacterium leiognathi TaxID=553611 RepID=UPI000C578086|nr:hypothetical protein [Photobacterium leiognathi]PHZ58986.1 hypothetical protein CRG86_015505 [Photobacterium leiognathi]PSW59152.1 hypothetical protein C0W50_01655 [Photobacterium leiognathi subsp. mandapamensis]